MDRTQPVTTKRCEPDAEHLKKPFLAITDAGARVHIAGARRLAWLAGEQRGDLTT